MAEAEEIYNKNGKVPRAKNEKTGLFDWLINHSKKIIIGVVVFALLISGGLVGVALYNQGTVDPNVVAEVAGKKIYLKEYKERLFAAESGLGTPAAPTIYEATKAIKGSVLNELVELKIVEKELSQRNIVISDSELIQEAKNVFKDYDSRDAASQKAYKEYVRLKVGKNKLLGKVASWKEGYALYCYFDRADQPDMSSKPADAAALRTKQEAYAKDYCTKAKGRLETGQSNYQDELAKLTADPIIGEASWKPYKMPFGRELLKDKFSSKYFHPAYDLFNRLLSLNNDKDKFYFLTMQEQPNQAKTNTGEVKKPEGLKEPAQSVQADKKVSNDTLVNQAQGQIDSMYMVVYIKEGHKSETTDFDKWLKDKWKDYQVKTYLERIKI